MSNYAIIDLEMCHVPSGERRKSFGMSQELIQIGAVLLDGNYRTVGTFMTYVRPEFGYVNKYIEDLTGIRQRDVSCAPTAAEALHLFFEWLPEDTVIVSWSDTDKFQLIHEIRRKDIMADGTEKYFEEWNDCQRTFSERMDTDRAYNLEQALNIALIYYDTDIHDALVDAKNTALLFVKMMTETELTLSPYIISGSNVDHGRFVS